MTKLKVSCDVVMEHQMLQIIFNGMFLSTFQYNSCDVIVFVSIYMAITCHDERLCCLELTNPFCWKTTGKKGGKETSKLGGSTWILFRVQDHMLAAGIEQDAQAYWAMRSEKQTLHPFTSIACHVCKHAKGQLTLQQVLQH